MRRAFHHIYNNILGSSKPAARLRATVWQSLFTHDMRRWGRALYRRMGNFPTLITGPSGTGKELVARAVGMSRYIPFDPNTRKFACDFAGSFHPLNLSALPATLIESELFGHKKGAFTGAVEDRVGWLQECEHKYRIYGTVFLDEIGELDAGIQVKLLRVLQTGVFHRLGESKMLHFSGKIISATNRDLADEMRAARFREDFYYRLCADRIETPSLREQLADEPDDLHNLLWFIARREIGDAEAESLATEVKDWIERNLPRDYPWPGNFRELEQCVRNIIIRRSYQPAQTRRPLADDPREVLAAAIVDGALTAAEMESRYFTLIFAQAGTYEAAAERLQCNWRTVRSKIDRKFLRQLQGG
jgi:DNA-binding NtrC family response regulator